MNQVSVPTVGSSLWSGLETAKPGADPFDWETWQLLQHDFA